MAENPSDQKSEDPTPRRLEKALEEGQIAFSSELVGGLMLLVGVLFLWVAGRWFFQVLMGTIRQRMTWFEPMTNEPRTILVALRENLIDVGLACLGMMIPLLVVSLAAGILQTRFNISFKPLALNWGKMNPLNGIKRIFSLRAVNRGGVAIAKVAVIMIAVFFLTRNRLDQIAMSNALSFATAIDIGVDLTLVVALTTYAPQN